MRSMAPLLLVPFASWVVALSVLTQYHGWVSTEYLEWKARLDSIAATGDLCVTWGADHEIVHHWPPTKYDYGKFGSGKACEPINVWNNMTIRQQGMLSVPSPVDRTLP